MVWTVGQQDKVNVVLLLGHKNAGQLLQVKNYRKFNYNMVSIPFSRLTMSHIVESCPLTKLNGGLSRLHSADEDAVSWLTNYGK